MNTSSITFLWQHENFVSLYCNDYFNGHNKLHIDDNEVIKDYDLESATVIINDLLAGIYRIWTSGPDGQSEDKYIEIYPEGIKEQLYYINDTILNNKNFKGLADYIIKISDERGLNLVESVYFAYLTAKEKEEKINLFTILISAVKLFNNYNFYNNIDNNSNIYINDSREAILHPEIVNGFISGELHFYKFLGKEYEYSHTDKFNESNVDLAYLDKDYLYRIDYINKERLLTNSYYIINPSDEIAKDIWPSLNKIIENINSKIEGLKYLPLAYQKFNKDTQLAISVLLDKNIDSPIFQAPKIAVDDGYITAVIDGADHYTDLNKIYFCITDVEGLASNQILFKKELDNVVIDLPMQGNSIYDGCYYSFLMNSNNIIVSPVILFNIDQDIQHNYINATLSNLQTNLLNFLYQEFEKEDVDKYYHYFTDCIGNNEITLSNYYDYVIDRLVQSNKTENFFDLIHYLNIYKYSNQKHRNNKLTVLNQKERQRIILPNDSKNYIMSSIKFNKGKDYIYDYKLISDNANNIIYSDADYTVINVFEENTGIHCGLITVQKIGNNYYFNNWNIDINNQLDF